MFHQCYLIIQELDHHCPWTGNCVAKRNYKYFIRFIIFITLFVMAITVFGILAMYKNVQEADAGQSWYKQIFEGLGSNPVDTGVTLLTFICTWSLVINSLFNSLLLLLLLLLLFIFNFSLFLHSPSLYTIFYIIYLS